MVTLRKPLHKHKVRCGLCSHPERHRIESMRLAGSPVDALAAKFNLGRDIIYRHMEKHVSADVKAMIIADVPLSELAEKAAAESMSLLDYLSLVRSTVMTQMLGAASVNDRSGTAKLAGRATEVLEQIGRLTGQLLSAAPVQNHITNNYTAIMATPAFAEVERMLLECLAPHPEALAAVVLGLERLDHKQAPQPGPLKALPVVEGSLAA